MNFSVILGAEKTYVCPNDQNEGETNIFPFKPNVLFIFIHLLWIQRVG